MQNNKIALSLGIGTLGSALAWLGYKNFFSSDVKDDDDIHTSSSAGAAGGQGRGAATEDFFGAAAGECELRSQRRCGGGGGAELANSQDGPLPGHLGFRTAPEKKPNVNVNVRRYCNPSNKKQDHWGQFWKGEYEDIISKRGETLSADT